MKLYNKLTEIISMQQVELNALEGGSKSLMGQPRNPDGPEAAALLREIMHMAINAATKEGQTFGGLLTDVGRMHKRMLDAGVPEE